MWAEAIVVGAGHNGLVAANLLADAGWRVLVLEAADHPGGAVHSAEIAAPGFTSDLCSSFYPMAAISPVFADLELELHGLHWRHAPDVLAHVLPDDRAVVLSRDVTRTAKSVSTFADGDGEVWQRLYEQWRTLREPLAEALFRPFPPIAAGANLLKAVGPADGIRLARMLTQSARALVEERFAGEGAQLLFAGNAMHVDIGLDNAGSGVFGWLLAMIGQELGFPVPEGGSGRLTDALVRRLTARGGEIRCGQRVSEVIVGNNTALGVRTHDGERIRATKAVLADVSAPALYLDLVAQHHLPARLLDDLKNFQWDPATVKVDWALSGPIPWTATEAAGAGTVHLDLDLNGLSAFGADMTVGRTPSNPFLLLGQMTTSDPTRSPKGTESVWAYTHVPRGQRWTPDRAATFADKMQQVIERHAPGFTDLVRGRQIQAPPDFERGNASLSDGALNGGTSVISQLLFLRPVPSLGRADTPIDRLYLASSSAHPGGGVHGAPGGNAARAALARAGWGGGAYRSVIATAHRVLYD